MYEAIVARLLLRSAMHFIFAERVHSFLKPFHMQRTVLPWVFVLFGLIGCVGVREPEAGPDVPPPPGYAPIFVNKIQRYHPSVTAPLLRISRVQLLDFHTVRLSLHVLDSSGVLYTGIATKDWQRLICEVRAEIGGRSVSLPYRLGEMTSATTPRIAVALALDHSGSMGEWRARILQQTAARFIEQKRSLDEVAIVKFDHHVVTDAPLSQSPEQLKSQLQQNGLLGFGGYTAIIDGAMAAIDAIAQSSAPGKVIILFTDGYDNRSRTSVDSLITRAKRLGISIWTIGFGYNIDEDFLHHLSAQTGGSYQRIYRTNELNLIFSSYYSLLTNYLTLDVNLKEYGRHRLTVKLCPPAPASETIGEAVIDNTPNVGSSAILNVYFDVDKAELKPESKPALDNVEAMMRMFPSMVIEVRGHTDSTGNSQYNLRLSERRAAAVRTELIKRGIAAERIRAVGFGDTQPIADNRTPEGRAQNRRTEFIILSK